MSHRTSILCRRTLRAYAAALISYLMLAGQVAPLALAAAPRAAAAGARPAAARPAAAQPAPAVAAALPAPRALMFAASVTATKTDDWDDTATPDGMAEPGQVITYEVTITNNGPDAATGVQFSDPGDPNTSLVPGSVQTQPIAQADTASAFGNVRISTANGAPNLLANDCDPDDVTGPCNDDLTASGPTTSTNNGNVVVNADGSFEYNPFPGFTGSDSFTYTIRDKGPNGTANDADDKTDTAVMTITVGPTVVWFIDNTAPSGGDGRITSPFNSIAAFNAGAADDPGDIIFIATGTGTYTGGLTLLNNQKLIGQGFALQTETGAPPAGSNALPGAGASPTIDNPGANIITLGQDNTLRGFNTGNSGAAGTDITGSNFGTLTVSALSINGDGRALNLTTGTLAATIANISASNTGTNAGISMNAVGGSLTVSGSTSITNPGGTGIDITNAPSGHNFNFGATTVNKNSTGGTGVNLSANLGTTTFSSLAVTTQFGTPLNISNGGTVNVTNAAGSSLTSTQQSRGLVVNNTAVAMNFTSISVVNPHNNSTNTPLRGIDLQSVTGGGIAVGATTVTNSGAGFPSLEGIFIQNSSAPFSFGNTTLSTLQDSAVRLHNNSGNISFGELDITLSDNDRGLHATDNTGTITVASGDLSTSGGSTASAVFIDGPGGGTPINLTFTTVTTGGAANSISLVDVSGTKFQVTGTTQINTRSGTGVFVDNSTTPTIQFATVNVPNPSNAGGDGIHVEDSSSAVTVATATIDNANAVTAQNDGDNNGIPENDGDGNAVFLRGNGGGSFTLNGGTLSNCGNDCIDVRSSQNLVLSGVTINNPGIDANGALSSGTGGHGIQAINLTGTNSITNSTITNWETQARDGLRWWNQSGTGTLTIHGSTFSNSESGSNAILYQADGNGTMMTLNVGGASPGQPNTFSQVFGAAITHNAGGPTAGTSPRADLNVINNTFSGTPNGGQNSVSSRNGSSGKAITVISGNTFDDVGRTLADTSGVIDLGTDATDANAGANGAFIHFTVTNNIIRNIGTTTACRSPASPLPCHGKRAIDVFIDDNGYVGNDTNAAVDADDEIVIDGNIITNVERAGIVFDAGEVYNGSEYAARITNNRVGIRADNTIDRVGTGNALATGGEWGILVENRNGNGKGLNIAISNNLVYNGNGGSGSALNNSGMLIRSQRSASINATVTNNTFNVNTSSSSFGINVGTVNTGAPFMCFDATGNTLSAPGGGIALTEAVGDLNVEQASAAALSGANGGATVTTLAGAPDFGVACSTPPSGPVSGGGADSFVSAIMFGLPVIIRGDGAAKSKSAFGGGVTDRPFLIMPRTAPRAAAPAIVAPKASVTRPALALRPSNNATRPADNARPANGVKPDNNAPSARAGDAVTVEQTAPIQTREDSSKKPRRASVLTDDPGVPNGSGVGITNFNIGTLAAGDSVTITFQVQIDNPYTGGPNVSNQGSVSGTNFSTVLTDDPDTGTAGDATLTPVNSVKININDAKVPEPASPNTVAMTFTVSLSQPATGTVTVNYATSNQTATGGTCGDAGVDYDNAPGQVSFATGEQVKTINVPVCSDAVSDDGETFLVTLSGATGGTIIDGTAVGTITANTPGTILISELRTSGPNGELDDFVELYNNTDVAQDVSGYGLFKMGADCAAQPVLVATLPGAAGSNTTVIPPRGHYLIVGTDYSLANYGGTGAAAGNNAAPIANIENDRNVALFSTADPTAISTTNRLDAVGFGTNNTGTCNLLSELSNLPAASGSTTQHTFFRKQCDFVGGAGCKAGGNPKDTNDNSADFLFANAEGTAVGGNGPRLGAPGPENLTSPIRRDTSGVFATLLDSTKPSSAEPNRHREFAAASPPPNQTFGTLSIRRRVTNTTGQPVHRLRFRIVEMTTHPTPGNGQADLRALSSGPVSVSQINDAGTCPPGPMPCTLTVEGTTLEQPPAQPNGGGYNSTLSAGTITMAQPLQNNSAINLQFLLGIEATGTFRFYIIVEALP